MHSEGMEVFTVDNSVDIVLLSYRPLKIEDGKSEILQHPHLAKPLSHF